MSDVFLNHVSKAFGKTVACDDVELSVERAEFLTLLGPSGCGKSTTLRLIAGFLKPDKGAVFVRDSDVTHVPPHRRNTAMVFQDWALFPHLNVYKNVAFGLEMRAVPKTEIRERVERALDLVRLSGMEERHPAQLSGGQQQRVALARALVVEPYALLLDEPLSNLDARLREEMRIELKELQRRLKITTIFVTHDQEEALVMSDRIAVMQNGKIEMLGHPNKIYNSPSTSFVWNFVGRANFFEGRISSKDIIETKGGLKLKAEASGHSLGAPVRVAIRVERALLERESGMLRAENVFEGEVVSVQFFGPVIHYVVRLTSGERAMAQRLNVDGSSPFKEGDSVYLGFKARDISFLPDV